MIFRSISVAMQETELYKTLAKDFLRKGAVEIRLDAQTLADKCEVKKFNLNNLSHAAGSNYWELS